MDKIIKQKQQKGITILELIIYMSILSVVLSIAFSSMFYIQKIIENNNYNYYVKNQLYKNFNVLQKYLYKYRLNIDTENKNISILGKDNKIILKQVLDNNNIKNIYEKSQFYPYEFLKLNNLDLKMINDNILELKYYWTDNRGNTHMLTDYLIVINQNL